VSDRSTAAADTSAAGPHANLSHMGALHRITTLTSRTSSAR